MFCPACSEKKKKNICPYCTPAIKKGDRKKRDKRLSSTPPAMRRKIGGKSNELPRYFKYL